MPAVVMQNQVTSCVIIISKSITVVQIDAGAEVIVTQPPLLWNKFEAWINSVQQ